MILFNVSKALYISFDHRSEKMTIFVLWLQLEGSRKFSLKGKEVTLSSKRG